MTDREKLLELIAIGAFFSRSADAEKCVDYLIANGVEIFNEEDEKALKMAQQRVMEAHGDLRYLEGVKFGVESVTKHGRWIGPTRVDANNNKYECSECGFWGVPGWAACPKCTAKMDGGAEDGNRI